MRPCVCGSLADLCCWPAKDLPPGCFLSDRLFAQINSIKLSRVHALRRGEGTTLGRRSSTSPPEKQPSLDVQLSPQLFDFIFNAMWPGRRILSSVSRTDRRLVEWDVPRVTGIAYICAIL